MVAGAVTASVEDGSATLYNPAGLARVSHTTIDVSASAYGLRFYHVPGFLRSVTGDQESASVTEFVAIPTEIVFVRPLGAGYTLGLGYFVPKAENVILRDRLSVPAGDDDLASVWALDIRSNDTNYWLVAALGIQLSERVSLGIGLNGVYDNTVSASTLFGGTSRMSMDEQAFQLSALRTAIRLSASISVGVQVDLGHGLRAGIGLRGPRLQLYRSDSTSVSTVLASLAEQDAPLLSFFTDEGDDAGDQVGWFTAGRYRAGFAYRFGDTEVSLEGDMQPGLRNPDLQVARSFTWNVRAGVVHEAWEDVFIGGGFFSDRATARDKSDSQDFYGATLGVQFDDLFRLARGERAPDLLLSSVFALRYAYGSGKTGTLVVDPQENLANLGESPGTLRVHEIGLHVGSALQF